MYTWSELMLMCIHCASCIFPPRPLKDVKLYNENTKTNHSIYSIAKSDSQFHTLAVWVNIFNIYNSRWIKQAQA